MATHYSSSGCVDRLLLMASSGFSLSFSFTLSIPARAHTDTFTLNTHTKIKNKNKKKKFKKKLKKPTHNKKREGGRDSRRTRMTSLNPFFLTKRPEASFHHGPCFGRKHNYVCQIAAIHSQQEESKEEEEKIA